MTTVKWTGVKAIDKRLKAMGSEVRAVLREGVKKQAQLVLKESKSNLRRNISANRVKRGLSKRAKARRREDGSIFRGLARSDKVIPSAKWRNARSLAKKGIIGARAGWTKKHAHLVEDGHDVVRNGKKIGRAPPYPFMRPAHDSTKSRFRGIMRQAALKGIRKAVKKRVTKGF